MKVALYARVSTDKQTTDNQMIRLREWAERNNWEVYKEYVDVASGKNTRRPSLTEMLNDAKMRYFDCIVAVKLDRIGRSVIDLKNIMEKLEAWEVSIKMMDQEIDTTTASGRFMITMLGAVAEFEREIIQERVNDGLERARREGKTLGRPKNTLSRYQIDKAKSILEADPTISQRKFAEQFDGIGRKQLISQLTDLGIWPPSGSKSLSGGVYKGGLKNTNGEQSDVSEPNLLQENTNEVIE